MIISICDDSPVARRVIKDMVLLYKERRKIPDLEVLEYDSPISLEGDLKKIESDIYLLDIFFPDGNGIELAKKIRLRYRYNAIVFITDSGEYMMRAFRVYALRYLLKPVHMHELFETLDYVFAKVWRQEQKYFPIRTLDGTRNLQYSSIMYVERERQAFLVTTGSGRVIHSVTLRKSFAGRLRELLADVRFVQTHVSFVVNIDAVEVYHNNYMVMQDGREIPISRKFQASLKAKFGYDHE